MGAPNPHYGTGVFRRRLRWRALSGRVEVELEDSNHGFCLTLHHDGEKITALDARPVRHPFTTCPEAVARVQRIVGLKVDDTAALREQLPQADNCTHLVDMALLAAGHAAGALPPLPDPMLPGDGWRLYDIAVVDECEGVTQASIRCDDQCVHDWAIRAHVIEAPADLAGKPAMRGFYAWAAQTWVGMPFEAAQLLQRGYFVAQARRWTYEPIEQNPGITDGMPHSACYSYNLGAVERALRIRGSVRNYSHSPERLLQFSDTP